MNNTGLSPIEQRCDECGAEPGERCRPFCTAEPAAVCVAAPTGRWVTFDRSTYFECGPVVASPVSAGQSMPRWCVTVRQAVGCAVWYLIDRSQVGDDGYALVVTCGEQGTVGSARHAAELALSERFEETA